jgi:hypothetical protein
MEVAIAALAAARSGDGGVGEGNDPLAVARIP